MRYGIVSDIHANLEALTRVLAELERLDVERVVCLGDTVGYHANPNECLTLLRQAGARCIAGNHDRAAVGVIEPRDFGRVARHAIAWTRRALAADHARFLRSLDVSGPLDERVYLVHAALHPRPNDRWHLSRPERIAASFARLCSGAVGSARICFFGHTHRPAVHRSEGRDFQTLALGPTPTKIQLDDAYYLINPGSVGQPRDGSRHAAFAVYDGGQHSVELHRVEYDVDGCLRKAAALGLLEAPPTWLERLRAAAAVSFARAAGRA